MLKPLLVIYFAEPMKLWKEGETRKINLLHVKLTGDEDPEHFELPDPVERTVPAMPGVSPHNALLATVPAEYVARFDETANAVYVKGDWELVATQDRIELHYLEGKKAVLVVLLSSQKVKSLRIVYGESIEELYETDKLG